MTHQSAFFLANPKADWWVMANSENIYIAPTKQLWKVVKKARGSDEKHSRRNLDDPDKRLFSRAHILPLDEFAKCCILIINR